MSITVKPSNYNPNVKKAQPDSWKTADTIYLPSPEPTAPLVIEDGKLPTPQDAALDYVAKQNELLRRRKNKQANK
jgi:hypothetical protein